jgi:hypothetical protein
MSVYDCPEGALVDLALSAATFVAGAAEDTAIGTLSGMMTDSVLSLFNDAGGAVKLAGSNLVVGATATPDAGTLNITVRETNEYGSNSPHDTALVITVTGA